MGYLLSGGLGREGGVAVLVCWRPFRLANPSPFGLAATKADHTGQSHRMDVSVKVSSWISTIATKESKNENMLN